MNIHAIDLTVWPDTGAGCRHEVTVAVPCRRMLYRGNVAREDLLRINLNLGLSLNAELRRKVKLELMARSLDILEPVPSWEWPLEWRKQFPLADRIK